MNETELRILAKEAFADWLDGYICVKVYIQAKIGRELTNDEQRILWNILAG